MSDSKYKLRQQIKELRQKVADLEGYRIVGIFIFREACNAATGGKNLDSGWVAKNFERVMK